LAGNDKEEIDRVKEALNKTFKIKDLGDLRYFLGFEVARSKKGIMMNQRKYALVTDIGHLACKHAVIPMDNLVKLSSTRSVPFTDVHAYRRLIGRLTPDLTSHFLFNNFLSFLISLQLLTIMQQLEF